MPRIELGGVVADTNALAVGEGTMRRSEVSSNATPPVSGGLYLGYFVARKTEQVSQVRIFSGSTAAAATPSLVRVGVYSVAANGDLALVGATPNDTSLFASTYTAYARSLSAPFTKVAGQRYASAWIVVTAAAMPTLLGLNGAPAAVTDSIWFAEPKLFGALSGQTDLPSSILNSAVAASRRNAYMELLP